MKIILAATIQDAEKFRRKYTTNLSDKNIIVVRGIHSLEGLRFRYEDVIRVPGWSQRSDIEEIEDVSLRIHITMPKE